MASKKIIKTQTNLGGSSRTIEHQDPKKSIEDLFTNRFVKKPNKGSSDDGFKSNSQLTLSPQSSTSPGGTPSGCSVFPFGGPPQAPATSWRSDPQIDPKDGLGPLPPGWTFGDDGNGCRYYIDHSRQFTTWEDPRLNPAALDHRQNPYGYPPQMPQNQRLMGEYSSANVQQLEAEKSAMRARQESLMRAGLLDPPQMMAGHEQYQQYPHHQPALHHVPPHQRQISADSALPDNMDAMDFTSYGLGMDINPQEFDKYLHISGNR
ncbi:unnamed protein product, partial [Mesorhabditis spiculigera]